MGRKYHNQRKIKNYETTNVDDSKKKNKITHIIEKKKNTLPPLQTLTHKILKTFIPYSRVKSKEKKDTAKSTKYYNYQIIPLCDRKSFPLITITKYAPLLRKPRVKLRKKNQNTTPFFLRVDSSV